MKRREFLFAAAAAVAPGKSAPVAKAPLFKKRIKFAISTYSYWHFEEKKFPIETVIERAAELGVEGVDILHRQMELKENAPLDAAGRAYCRKLKRLAFRNGLDVVCLSTHQNFVSPDPKARQAAVNHTLKCLEIADALGAACIRVNAGRWNTIPDFDEFMKKRGLEPPIAGRTEDEAFEWSIDCLGKCLLRATARKIRVVDVIRDAFEDSFRFVEGKELSVFPVGNYFGNPPGICTDDWQL